MSSTSNWWMLIGSLYLIIAAVSNVLDYIRAVLGCPKLGTSSPVSFRNGQITRRDLITRPWSHRIRANTSVRQELNTHIQSQHQTFYDSDQSRNTIVLPDHQNRLLAVSQFNQSGQLGIVSQFPEQLICLSKQQITALRNAEVVKYLPVYPELQEDVSDFLDLERD